MSRFEPAVSRSTGDSLLESDCLVKESWLRRAFRGVASFVPEGTKVPVMRGPLAGYSWYAGATAGRGKGLTVCVGMQEPEQSSVAVRVCRGVAVAYDIGANVGYYSCLFAKNGVDRIYAFEPEPRNIMWLNRIVGSNSLKNVVIVPCAMSDHMSLSGWEEGSNAAMGHLSHSGSKAVATVSVDEFSEAIKAVPGLIKIDVERAELSVLQGAAGVLKCGRPALLLSVHSDALRSDCISFLRDIGYGKFGPIDSDRVNSANELIVTW